MMGRHIFFVGLLGFLMGGFLQAQNPLEAGPPEQHFSVVHHLVYHIFSRYHRAATVVKPVVVNLDVLLIKVKGTVEKEGIFETVIALFIRWSDARLSWDPNEYDNITSLSLDADQVGLPDIAMINSADHLYGITRHNKFQVQLSSTGNMKYVPTGTARTWCDLKLFTFPFDVQKCSLEFESWSLDHKSMTFDGLSDIVLDKAFVSNLWTICDLQSTTYDQTYFTNETFTRVRFDITVRRRQTFYVVNLIFPCTTLSLIQLSVFWISSTDTTADRIGFSTTNLLTLVVFQTIVTEELPKTSDAVTALSKYIIALILTSALGIFESVIVERFFRTFQKPPPCWLFYLLKCFPFLWRELPSSHPKSEEADQIFLSARRSGREKVKKGAKRKAFIKVKVKPRANSCNSPVFSRRSSVASDFKLEEDSFGPTSEKTQLLKSACCGCNNHSEITSTFGSYALVNQRYHAEDEDKAPPAYYNKADTLIKIPLPQTTKSVPCCESISSSKGFGSDVLLWRPIEQSTMVPNGDCCKPFRDLDAYSVSGEVPSTNKPMSNQKKHSTSAFFFHRNTGGTNSQRFITLPALSPRLQEQMKEQDRKKGNQSRRSSTTKSKLQEHNACLWMELAFKLDFVTFVISLMLSVFIPIGLFVPFIYFGNMCVPSYQLDSSSY